MTTTATAPDDATPRREIESFEPATGRLMGRCPALDASGVRGLVERARAAQIRWGALPVEERARQVLRFRDALVSRQDEVVERLCRETGKPRIEALVQEVVPTANTITYFAKRAAELLAPREVPLSLLKHRKSEVHYAPRGVVGVISPWNYPLFLPLRDVTLALLAGNTVVLKPSEVTPLIALLAQDVWERAGLERDVFLVATGYGDAGAALVASGIQLCVFTGGVATGRRVAAACGERLVPCVMELGGKAPLVACADADVERTARAAVWGGFSNAGQICISVERVYAHHDVADRLEKRMQELVRELRVGDPTTGDVDVGAMIFGKQIDVVEAHVRDAVGKGARVLAGGQRLPGPGQFFEPTLLAGCDHRMTVMREEIFGPVVPIMRVANDDEAIRLANDSHLGLNAYVFSSDAAHGRAVAERIQAGSVLVNDVLTNGGMPEAPFGGIKQSGFGRVLGDDSLREMCDVKHVCLERFAVPAMPYWFPYEAGKYATLRRASGVFFGGGSLAERLGRLFD